jgi:hypothetical protein
MERASGGRSIPIYCLRYQLTSCILYLFPPKNGKATSRDFKLSCRIIVHDVKWKRTVLEASHDLTNWSQPSHPIAMVRNDKERRDRPDPFSSTRRLVEERATTLVSRRGNLSENDKSASLIEWEPSLNK